MNYVKPKSPPEAAVHFELAYQLRDRGIRFDVEYQVPLILTFSGGQHQVRCRFDLVVLLPDKDEIICIIEVKRNRSRSGRLRENTWQLRKYRSFGVPVFMCRSLLDVPTTVQRIHELHDQLGYEPGD